MKDATRNSINMLAQSKFRRRELQGVSCNNKQEMLFQQFGINWNDIDQGQKSGFMCLREEIEIEVPEGPYKGDKVKRNAWQVKPSPANLTYLRDILSTVLEKE